MGMSDIPLADMVARIASLEVPLKEALDRVLRSGRFILGPEVQAFEESIAERCSATHGVGVSSGTDALIVTLMALGIGPGDEVVTTPMSFFASVGAIVRLGARPVFADIDPVTFNLDAEKAAERVTERTKAVEVVHLFGQCSEVGPLTPACERVGAVVIEDAAQAIGADRDGERAGSFGIAGCLSFFPTKNLGGIGDGGMVVTSDDDLADRIRMLRAHGAKPKYYHHHVGGNFRLDAIQAAALRVMLPHLDTWTDRRRKNAQRYDEMFERAGLVGRELIVPPGRDEACFHTFHHYVVRVPRDRDALKEHLSRAGIATAVYYPVCLHLQPCFADLGHKTGDFPVAEQVAKEILAIPVYPELKPEQQERVVSEISKFFD